VIAVVKATPIQSGERNDGWQGAGVLQKKSKAETADTRRRIVEIASKAFRSQGIEATGVDQIIHRRRQKGAAKIFLVSECAARNVSQSFGDFARLSADRPGGRIAMRCDPLNELGEYFVGHVRSLNVL
jgi:hypothetical protein